MVLTGPLIDPSKIEDSGRQSVCLEVGLDVECATPQTCTLQGCLMCVPRTPAYVGASGITTFCIPPPTMTASVMDMGPRDGGETTSLMLRAPTTIPVDIIPVMVPLGGRRQAFPLT